MAEPWFETTYKLRFNDCDPLGHINNAAYVVLFEAGRTDLQVAAGLDPTGGRFGTVIVRLEVDFRREMRWPGDAVVQTAIARIGRKSIHTRQRILNGDTLRAEATCVLAVLDRETRRAIELDDAWRQRFAPWMLPEPLPA